MSLIAFCAVTHSVSILTILPISTVIRVASELRFRWLAPMMTFVAMLSVLPFFPGIGFLAVVGNLLVIWPERKSMIVLARWKSRGGAHYVELRKSADCYSYRGNGCGGSLGGVKSDEEALAIMQAQVDSGYFLPDRAKLPMERVGPIASSARIVKGPTHYACSGVWEVIVSLPVYSDKLAAGAYAKLPEYADFDGCIYRKHGFRGSDCTAWYRFKA